MWKIRNYLLLYFADIGTTYVRWARKQCPYNYTELVYSGRCPYDCTELVYSGRCSYNYTELVYSGRCPYNYAELVYSCA